MCASTRSGSCPRTRAACVDRVPGELLRPLRRIRLHRRPGRAARPHLQQRDRLARGAARLLARFHRRGRRDQGAAHRAGDRRARRDAGAAPLPAARRTAPIRASARTASTGRLVAEARQVRRLHRLLELSRMPATPASSSAGADGNGDGGMKKLGEDPETGLDVTLRSRPLRPLSAARRRQVNGEKPKRAGLPKGMSPDDVDLDTRARAAVAAARGRQASRRRRADHRRHRPLRPLRAARQDLRQSRARRRRAHHRRSTARSR